MAAVINRFKGHVRQMLRHAAASSIIEYAYNDKAVLAQRLMLTDELYGNTYTVCKVNTHTQARKYCFISAPPEGRQTHRPLLWLLFLKGAFIHCWCAFLCPCPVVWVQHPWESCEDEPGQAEQHHRWDEAGSHTHGPEVRPEKESPAKFDYEVICKCFLTEFS